MPMGAVTLMSGVDVEKTLSLNEAGISESQLIRSKNDLTQTYGGWQSYGSVIIPSTVKDLHPWQDISGVQHLGVGATGNLIIVTSGVGTDVTPQTVTNNITPAFTTTIGSCSVIVADPGSGQTTYNSVFFNTPIAIDNLLLNGPYKIASILSTGSYTIVSTQIAAAGVVSSGVLPGFNVSSGSPFITVTLDNNNFLSAVGLSYAFRAPTTVGGVLISGPYQISSILSASRFTITATQQASATSSGTMNSSLAQLVYYIAGGPAGTGTPWSGGGFGTSTFGGVGGTSIGISGTPITALDWSQDNWGEVLLSCPKDGPIYAWSPDSGLSQAQVIPTAPFFNGGIFISMPQQILVAWKSTQSTGVQDNLVVRWSNALDYTNWEISNATTAGAFHIPTGSVIRGGLQAPNYGVIWTDIDVWLMQYVGGTVIFNFTRVGTGCGLIGQHAAGVLSGNVYWCGTNNFFTIDANGVKAIPCTVWDFIFQNVNPSQVSKICCAPNSVFNEIAWFFPSLNATENDSYVKFNTVENKWDYGLLTRTAWTDVSVLGNPIGADSGGVLYQHEIGESTTGTGLPSFRSGWWALTEGNDMAFVDYVIPDFKYGFFPEAPPNAEINITFFSANYPGDVPVTYGPYTVTPTTQYLSPRIRGRLMSVFVQSNNQQFWRLGKIRFRYAISGRR